MSDKIDEVLATDTGDTKPLDAKAADTATDTPDKDALLAQKEAEIATLQERYRNLQSVADKVKAKADEVSKISGTATPTADTPTEMSEAEKHDLEYLKKLGFTSKDEVQTLAEELKAIKEQKAQESATERRAKFDSEMNDVAKLYPFVDRVELVDYILERAKQGTNLAPSDAVFLKYRDQIITSGIKPTALPGVQRSTNGPIEEPSVKPVGMESPALRDRINERLRNAGVSVA